MKNNLKKLILSKETIKSLKLNTTIKAGHPPRRRSDDPGALC
jgi:hypothetical protein